MSDQPESAQVQCRNCDFYQPGPSVNNQPEQGICRERAPSVVPVPVEVKDLRGHRMEMRLMSVWPTVQPGEWCGRCTVLDADEPQSLAPPTATPAN